MIAIPVEACAAAARRASFETRDAANDNARLRLVSNNGITLVYDGRNRVASSTGSGITTNYWVNGLGQRVRKTWNGTPASHVLFTYAPDGKHIGSYDLNGALTEETIFLGDTPIATVTGAGTFNLYADHINAIRQITNQTNQTRWSWEQTNAFGSTLPNQNPTGLGTFNYRRGFPGQFYDAELLTWNNGFRTYHAGLGRYLQPDPIGLAGGDPSNYTYARNNSTSYADPLGLIINVNGSAEFVGYYNAALRYLWNSPYFRMMYDYVYHSPNTYNINELPPERYSEGNGYNNRDILWAPKRALVCLDLTFQTAAFGLAHEFGHAYRDAAGLSDWPLYDDTNPLGNLAATIFTRPEELGNLYYNDTRVALELGEPFRISHKSWGYYSAFSPTTVFPEFVGRVIGK